MTATATTCPAQAMKKPTTATLLIVAERTEHLPALDGRLVQLRPRRARLLDEATRGHDARVAITRLALAVRRSSSKPTAAPACAALTRPPQER